MEERTQHNLFIGKTIDGTYMFLEESFRHDGGFSGLTGYELEFHTEEEGESSLDDLFDGEGYEFFLQYLEKNRPNDISYNDWCDMVRDERGDDYDDSWRYEKCVQDALEYANEKEGEDYELTNCIGAGRHFDENNVKSDYYEYFIPENLELLQKLYNEYEK